MAETLTLDQAFALAVEHQLAGRLDAAEHVYGRILAAQPRHAQALHNLAVLAQNRGRHGEAERLFRAAATARPGYASAFRGLTATLLAQGNRVAEAETAVRQALAFEPGHKDALALLGRLQFEQGRPAEAAESFAAAAARDPRDADLHGNLGAALRLLARLDEAEAALRRAVMLDPGNPHALNNLGSTLKLTGRLDAALAALRRAQRVAPDFAGPHWNEALTLLLAGRMAEGWAKYVWRWKTQGFPSPVRGFAEPLWTGQPIAGRRLLIYWEQGFGDTLQFIRYAPLVKAMGATVIVECQRQLFRLFRSVPGIDELVAAGDPLPAFDYQTPLLGLPLVLGTTLETVPANIPYFAAEPSLARRWGERMRTDRPGLRVGLVWAGNTTFGEDRLRSPRLASFLPLFEVPGVRFFGLQMGPGRADLAEHRPPADRFLDLGAEIADFTDTAAIMAQCDLVISSCTSPVHLSGGLGRPTWVVIPYAPDFRWMLGRDDSPWYPSVRLFRQDAPGRDWGPVVGRVVAALRRLVEGT